MSDRQRGEINSLTHKLEGSAKPSQNHTPTDSRQLHEAVQRHRHPEPLRYHAGAEAGSAASEPDCTNVRHMTMRADRRWVAIYRCAQPLLPLSLRTLWGLFRFVLVEYFSLLDSLNLCRPVIWGHVGIHDEWRGWMNGLSPPTFNPCTQEWGVWNVQEHPWMWGGSNLGFYEKEVAAVSYPDLPINLNTNSICMLKLVQSLTERMLNLFIFFFLVPYKKKSQTLQ